MEMNKIAPFFSEWNETFIWSCLQGHMGLAITDDEEKPSCAQIVLGDFCLFAGKPSSEFAKKAAAPIIIPKNEEWEKVIEEVWGKKVKKDYRYAIKKEPVIFKHELLKKYSESLDCSYKLCLFDKNIYEKAMRESWSKDFCSLFCNYEDYKKRGLGVAVMNEDHLVAGASSYSIYNGGIEIEIDTKPEYRRRRLATACGAKLILECLARDLYPSWDAHDLRSVALAEKLGYHMEKSYVIFKKI